VVAQSHPTQAIKGKRIWYLNYYYFHQQLPFPYPPFFPSETKKTKGEEKRGREIDIKGLVGQQG
jgi:hypothetical protein